MSFTMDNVKKQYVITFEAAAQASDTKAVDDMFKMITGYLGHIDFVVEPKSNSSFKVWTVVYTADHNLNKYCPESCYLMYR